MTPDDSREIHIPRYSEHGSATLAPESSHSRVHMARMTWLTWLTKAKVRF